MCVGVLFVVFWCIDNLMRVFALSARAPAAGDAYADVYSLLIGCAVLF